MTIVLFEDELWQHFATLVQARPVFELRCGAYSARERATAVAAAAGYDEGEALGLARSHLMSYYGPSDGMVAFLKVGTPITLVNGRALDMSWLSRLLSEPLNTVYLAGATLLGAKLSPGLASAIFYYLHNQAAVEARDELLRFARSVELGADGVPLLLQYPWDLVAQSGEQLVRDLPLLERKLPLLEQAENVTIRGERVYVSPEARLDGPIVLDARDGPVFIEADARIEPFSFIQGPTYIGTNTLIASARIRGETSIGPVCRVGGEVEASIIHGYSNKHHDGFLGHAWLGEWVNIGAMTTNSDLKNNYGSVRVQLEGLGQLNSELIKLGCFLADHVKLGIGQHLSGGTMIGTGSNVFGIHSVPKNVPHFTWGGDVFREYRIESMISVARTVMGRRKRKLEPAYERVLRAAFELTRPGRADASSLGRPSPESEQALAKAEADSVRG